MGESISGFRRIRGHTIYMPPLGEDSLVIDAGAHKGEFADEIHSLTGCRCLQVEPHPLLFKDLNPPSRGSKVHAALSFEDGEQAFSFDSNLEGGSIARKTDTEASVRVKTLSLTSLLRQSEREQVDLLKLDIEGAEFDLIAKTPDDVWSQVKQVTVEFHDFLPEFQQGNLFKKAATRLSRLGFRMRNMAFQTHGDVIFVQKAAITGSFSFTLASLFARFALKAKERLARHHENP